MTTVVGIQGDGFAVLGVDNRITSFDSSGNAYQVSTLSSTSSKIAVNGKYLLGAAGDMRAINILHHVFSPPAPAPLLRGKKLDAFITGKFIPALIACFDSCGYSMPDSKDDKEHMSQQGSTIVVVVNGTIYFIEDDYSWTPESHGLYAAGTGSAYALGALTALVGGKNLSPSQCKTLALKALGVAGKYDPYSGSPYQTFVQESASYKAPVPVKAPAKKVASKTTKPRKKAT